MEISGFKPACWGSVVWYYLNIIAFGYPEYVPNTPEGIQLKNDTYTFFKVLGSMLPCSECKQHYKQNIDFLNLANALDNRSSLTKFVYELHNLVNEQTGIPKNLWPSYQEVCDKFNALRSTDCDPTSCSSGPQQFRCKVDIVPNDVEGFSSNSNTGLAIGLGLLIFIGLVILFVYLNTKKKN